MLYQFTKALLRRTVAALIPLTLMVGVLAATPTMIDIAHQHSTAPLISNR